MIKFFRRFRRDLLGEKRLGKYLLYAIGEIVLVIIGILIALNINNKNELRKIENQFIFNLLQVRNELKANIENTTKGIDKYQEIDSLLGIVMSDTLEPADFKTSEGYYLGNILVKGFNSTISNNSFKRLNSVDNNLDATYNPLIFKLDSVYLIREKQLIKWNERMTSLRYDNERELTKSQTWYYDYLSKDIINDEGVEYFLTDSFYKNNIGEYYKLSRNHLTFIKRYRLLAIEAYIDINELLKSKNKFIADSLDFMVTSEIQNKYIGAYRYSEGDISEIYIKDDQLKLLIIQGKDSLDYKMHALSTDRYFVIDDGVILEFTDNDEGNPEFLIWKMLGGEFKFKNQKI